VARVSQAEAEEAKRRAERDFNYRPPHVVGAGSAGPADRPSRCCVSSSDVEPFFTWTFSNGTLPRIMGSDRETRLYQGNAFNKEIT
jgi:hypothetical protein